MKTAPCVLSSLNSVYVVLQEAVTRKYVPPLGIEGATNGKLHL